MATKGSGDVGFLLIAGRDIESQLLTITDTNERDVDRSDGLSASVDSYQDLGVDRMTLSLEGLLNTATGEIEDALKLQDEQVIVYAPVGNAIGDPFIGMNAVQETFKRNPAQGQLTRVSAEYKTSEFEEGVVLAPHTARTTEGPTDTTHLDNAASTAAGGVGYIAVSALTLGGTNHVLVHIRDSTDNVTYATLITFNNITAVNAVERLTVAGTVNRYLEVRHQFIGGSFSGGSITFAVGFKRS